MHLFLCAYSFSIEIVVAFIQPDESIKEKDRKSNWKLQSFKIELENQTHSDF